MDTTLTKHERNLSAIIHASTFSRYFIPFGNFILPLVLWTANKKDHKFVDYNGKQALNFQISMFLYAFLLGVLTIPFFFGAFSDIFHTGYWSWRDFGGINWHFNSDDFRFGHLAWPLGIGGFLQGALSLVNIIYTILATIRTNEGQYFQYPFTIKFIK